MGREGRSRLSQPSGKPELHETHERARAARPPALETSDELGRKVGESVHGALRLDEAGAAQLDLAARVHDGLDGEHEGAGGGGDREAVPGSVPEDGKTFPAAVVGAPPRLEAAGAGTQEVVLDAPSRKRLPEGVDLRGEGVAGSHLGERPAVGDSDPAAHGEEGAEHGGRVDATCAAEPEGRHRSRPWGAPVGGSGPRREPGEENPPDAHLLRFWHTQVDYADYMDYVDWATRLECGGSTSLRGWRGLNPMEVQILSSAPCKALGRAGLGRLARPSGSR
jgi:hypothetical protein